MSIARRRLAVLVAAVLSALLVLPQAALAPTAAAAPAANGVEAVAYSPDGASVAIGAEDGSVFVYTIGTGRLVTTMSGHRGSPVTAAAFSPAGDLLATAGRDSTVQLWNTKGWTRVATLTGHEHAVLALAFSADGATLVSGGEDSRAVVWDVAKRSLKTIITGQRDFVTGVAVSPDNATIALATKDAKISLRDAATYRTLATLRGHAGEVTSVAFSPDGKSLASGSADKTVKLWDVKTRAERAALKGHSGAVTSLAFSRDGTNLASGDRDGSVRLWNPTTGSARKELAKAASPVQGLAFRPDGTQLLEGRADGTAKNRSVSTGAVTRSITVPEESSTDTAPTATSTLSAESAEAPTALSATPEQLAAGPGGPILVITSSANSFSNYYAEILRAEGLNSFGTMDIGSVDAAALANYDVVILAARSLSSAQVSTLSTWVTSGGNLIAMRPTTQLAGLLGLTAGSATLSEGYLKVDTSTKPGNGIVGETIQFHGTADRHTLNGARAVATLYSSATTATSNPAVTLNNVGSQGGQAASFAYDLARSIVYTRQGNPAWAGQERDGFSPIRSDDLYYGNRAGDVQKDWIDLSKVQIPQADEQQRLLVNLILEMNADRKPLPRFWYLPRGLKAAVIMTGDDHGNNGTEPRFNQFLAESAPGCSVEDWECIRGTSYIYPNTPLTAAKATSFAQQGFEIGVHVNTNCQDWTPTSLANDYTSQIATFASKYPSVPAPTTNRTHCIAWSDWSTQASVSLTNGIRLDTNYYYWPPSWVDDRAGFFTGSGVPMRFTDPNGSMIDVYQAATQMTDESGQSWPSTIDTLLDRALGPEGYYGAFTINAHTDVGEIVESTSVVASAKARGVPVITSKQMLDWVDGRNASTFQSVAWNNGQLSFAVQPGATARNLDMLLPTRSGSWTLTSVTRDGAAVSYDTTAVKGADYAFVRANAGAYVATYQQDTTAPTITSTTPTDGATGIVQSAPVTATFSEEIDPSTVSSSTVELRTNGGSVVPGTVSYDATSKTARLVPGESLAPNTQYRATFKGGTSSPTIRDAAGIPLASDASIAFTTATGPSCPCTIWPSSAEPVNKVESDPNAVELGVKFRSDVDGFITGVRFWKGSQNTGTHTGNLWTTSGERLATAQFSGETATGWQEVTFSEPVAVSANTTYVASYHTTSGYYAGDNGYFATSGTDNAPLRALSSTSSGGNGVYAYGATSQFPSDTWQASNYWVDVVFTTTTGPDVTPPTVTATSPADGATGVATNARVNATFNEPLDPATVSASTASITGPSGAVASAVSYDAATRSVVLQPSATLAPSTTYTVRLKGGPTDPRIKDAAGNALAVDVPWSFTTAAPGACDSPANAVVAENCRPGSAASEWDVSGAGDPSIQGFATDISADQGQTVSFKIDTTAADYDIGIYRLGWYGGDGARLVATIPGSATTSTNQPDCLTQPGTGLVDCGNWSTSASWAVPADAVSGLYLARPTRSNGGASHIPFVVRDDDGGSDLLMQTSDTTWQAYNQYGGNSLYTGSGPGSGGSADGRAYAVSYNRPFTTRDYAPEDWIFNAEYPMIRWLERNGYDVSYTSGIDTDRRGSELLDHKAFVSVGHDEYWSGQQRANVEAARDAGVNLAFFSGNEVFWRTRWAPSIDGSATPNRTLVSYKETHNYPNNPDPSSEWTGTWRDPRDADSVNLPENGLTGQIFMVNSGTVPLGVPAEDGLLRFWRNSSVAGAGADTLGGGLVGYEWDEDLDNGFRPAGQIRMSSTTATVEKVDPASYGSTFQQGSATHSLTLHRDPQSGALVFGAGTVQWSWGLDSDHDRGSDPAVPAVQQATLNLFADMDAQPATLMTGLTPATKSTDTTAPTAVIANPTQGQRLNPNTAITISGTATDVGGRVGGVEVSTDNGQTWQLATGRATWSYNWTTPASGDVTIKVRATDDSANLQSVPTAVTVTVGSLPPPAVPTGLTAAATATGMVLDWADGGANVTGYHVYRSTTAGGTYTRVTGAPVVGSAWEDTLAPAGASYYRVTALNSTGGESAQSEFATASMATGNRLVNPSFELDANGDNRPDSWTSSARFLRDTAEVRGGTYSGRHQSATNVNYTIAQARTGLTAGTAYSFAGWVNVPATADAFTFTLRIQWRNASNAVISTETIATYTGATIGWVKASGTYTAPAGTTRARVEMVSNSLKGPVYVDDFALR